MEGENSHPSVAAGGTRLKTCNNLSLIYYNARSLVPKFDELCLIVSVHKPDIVAIVETWLCPDISDQEICIPGYHLFRLDRNRHGGEVLLYVRDCLTAEVLPCDQANQLELLPIVIHYFGCKFFISVFYRPPNSPTSIFDTLFCTLASLNVPSFSHSVLVGDFNVNMLDSSHHLYHKVHSLLDYFNFTQVVSEPTHLVSSGNSSLIDLALLSDVSCLHSCTTLPPLSTSDHLGLSLALNLKKRVETTYSNPQKNLAVQRCRLRESR